MNINRERFSNYILVEPPRPEGTTLDAYMDEIYDIVGNDWIAEGAAGILLEGISDLWSNIKSLSAGMGPGQRTTIGKGRYRVTMPEMPDYPYMYGAWNRFQSLFFTQPIHRFTTCHPRTYSKEAMVNGKVKVVDDVTTLDVLGPRYKHKVGAPYDQVLYLRQSYGKFQALTSPEGLIFAKVRKDAEKTKPIDLPDKYPDLCEAFWRRLAKESQVEWAGETKFNTCFNGPSGTGKSRTATSLPPEFFKEGRLVVVGFDEGATNLQSTPAELLETKNEVTKNEA